jgi:hypothetical protein
MRDGALDRVFDRSWRRACEAKELPIDAALGLIDAIDVMSYPSSHLDTAQLWYRLLNCGIRLAATAGSDTFMNATDQDEFSNPPAGVRAFVRIDGEFSTESWCQGVRAGRTFVTNGPMLSLDVTHEGTAYAPGDEIKAHAGDTVRIEAQAGSIFQMERVELLVNGHTVESTASADGVRQASLTYEFAVDSSCWVALRAIGAKDERVMDDYVFSHTSPVYVTVDGKPQRSPDDAAYFADWIDRLIAMTAERGVFESERERDDVIAEFGKGRAYYGS